MLVTTKQKRTLKLALLIVFVAIIIFGMGIGIYFIVRDNSSNILSKREQSFGEAVNAISESPSFTQIDITKFDNELMGDIVFYTDSYVVTKTNTLIYGIYSIKDNSYVNLRLIGDFESVQSIVGNLALIKQNGVTKLISLLSGEIVSNLENMSIEIENNLVLLKTQNYDEIHYIENGENIYELGATIVDAVSLTRVFNVTFGQECIGVNIAGNLVIASYVDRTDIFDAASNFALIKTFQNDGKKVINGGNLTSLITGSEYYMSSYTRAVKLENDKLLIETMSVTDDNNFDITASLSDGQKRNYKLLYRVYDLNSGLEFLLENNGKVIKAVTTNLDGGYFACLECDVINKEEVSSESQTIHYYKIENTKSGYKIYSLVSYDYVAYGKIVGFSGTTLLTSGGENSTIIDFSGENKGNINTASGLKINQVNYGGAVIVSSSIGQKMLYSLSGEKLTGRSFERVSPFTSGKAIGFDGVNYYLLNSSGQIARILNFAEEYSSYVFMGIGYYFTTTNHETYNVYDFTGKLLHQNTKITLNYDENLKKVSLNIDGQTLYIIAPLNTSISLEQLEIEVSNGFGFTQSSNSNFSASNSSSYNSSSYSGFNKNIIAGNQTLEASNITVDPTSGVGTASYSLDLNLRELGTSVFKTYSSLTDEEKALVPEFDDQSNLRYTITLDSETYWFRFDGLYTIVGENFVIGIIRLYTSNSSASLPSNVNNPDFYYMVTMAFKDSYVATIDAKTTNNEGVESTMAYYTESKIIADIDWANNVRAAGGLDGKAVTYIGSSTEAVRDVDYAGAGYDGGLVLSSNLATNITLNFTLRNAYYGSISTSYMGYSSGSNNYDKFTVSLSGGTARIQVKNSYYVITGISVIYANTATSTYEEFEGGQVVNIDGPIYSYSLPLQSGYSYVRLNVTLCESYSKLILQDIVKVEEEEPEEGAEEGEPALGDGEEENAGDEIVYEEVLVEEVYFFYGYGIDVSTIRNPAYFGFENYFRRESVSTTSRDGYTFRGYVIKDTENKVIDEDGSFIEGSESYFISSSLLSQIATFNLNVSYEPNEYLIFYVSNNRPIADVQTNVTFDQPVGELFTIIGTDYELAGYDFVGWFNSTEEDAIEYTSETIYQVVGNLTLYAKWKPKEYEVTFNANLDTYQNIPVLGFNFNVTDVYFASAFGDFTVNDAFLEGVTKTVTFGETYGELPNIVGYNSQDELEVYIFVGWSDSATFTEEAGVINRGTMYTSSSRVTATPATTLYAHYTKQVLYANLEILASNQVISEGGRAEDISETSYDGSTPRGAKATFSTIADMADYEWVSTAITNGVRYTSYILQGEPLKTNIFVAEGYYIITLQIRIYESDGTYETYLLEGKWDPDSQDAYNLDTSSLPSYVTVVTDGFDVQIDLRNTYSGATDGSSVKHAEIVATIDSTKFTNTLSIGMLPGIEGNAGTISGLGLVDQGNGVYIHELITNGTVCEYSVLPMGATSYGSSYRTNDVYLRNITIDDQTIEFSYTYAKDNKRYIHNLTSNYANKVVSYDDTGNRTEVYTVGDVALKIVLYVLQNRYEYSLTITNNDSHNVSLAFDNISSNVSINLTNIGDESSDADGMTFSGNYYENNISQPVALDGLEYAGLKPSEKLIYIVRPNDYFFISAVSVRYNGTLYNFAYPTISDSNDTTLSVSQDFNLVASAELFERMASGAKLYGTGFSIEWIGSTRGLQIVVNDICVDIEINVEYMQYRILQVYMANQNDGAFSVAITTGSDTYVGKTLDEISIETGAVVLKGVYKRYINSLSSYSYLIIGLENSIRTLTLNTLVSESSSYKLTTTYLGDVTINSELTKADINLDGENMSARLAVEEALSYIDMESYLGRGGDTYVLDPISGFGVLSNLKAIYHNRAGERVVDSYVENYARVAFVGTSLVFRVYNIVGYTYSSSGLYLVDGGTEVLVEPTSETSGSDSEGGYREFTYQFGDFSKVNYLFKVYQKAIEYTIKYDSADDGQNIATGTTEDSHHVYNVYSNLSTNGFERVGYTFVGYSKTRKTGSNLTESDAEYLSNQVLRENLSSEDGGEVILYAVFVAKTYNIIYNTNDATEGNGSSPAINQTEGNNSVVFDHDFGVLRHLTRQGYTFIGWFKSKDSGAEQIASGNRLNIALLNTLDVANDTITIYAHYNALTYNVTIVMNDATAGNGSTVASGSVTGYTITYDQSFTLPAITRFGYDFMGYKSVQLTATEAENNTLSYLGYGTNSKNVIDYSVSNSQSGYNLQIDDTSRSITLYATYIAKVFSGYVYLNNESLKTYGNDVDGRFTVTFGGLSESTSFAYTNICVSVKFDSAFGTLPTVSPVGYNFEGFFSSSSFSLSAPSTENQITSATVLNQQMVNALSYTNSSGQTTSLSSGYNSGNYNFSLYAHYTNMNYTMTYELRNVNRFHLEAVSDYLNYNYRETTSSDSYTNNVLSANYGDDIIVDIMPDAGTYVGQITISYVTSLGTTEYINLKFTWVPASRSVSVTINGRSYNSASNNDYITVLDDTAYIAEGVYIKMLPYNTSGADSSNICTDTNRIILGFESIKTNFTVSAIEYTQTYKISLYKHYGSTTVTMGSTTVSYGTTIRNANLTYDYMPAYSFSQWRYNTYLGSVAASSDQIKSNTTLVAIYNAVSRQSVNFYMWNPDTGRYELREETSEAYILYNNGSVANSNFSNGCIVNFPTPSSELWPTGTSFAGYILASSAPSSGYYSWSSGNASSYTVLTSSVKIESELNAYAVYDTTYFNIYGQSTDPEEVIVELPAEDGSEDVVKEKHINISVQVDSNYLLYDIQPNGVVRQYTYQDIYYVVLTQAQYNTYRAYSSSQPPEVALRYALNGDLSDAKRANSYGYFTIMEYDLTKDSEDVNIYVFAITIKTVGGVRYIYDVADGYYHFEYEIREEDFVVEEPEEEPVEDAGEI